MPVPGFEVLQVFQPGAAGLTKKVATLGGKNMWFVVFFLFWLHNAGCW